MQIQDRSGRPNSTQQDPYLRNPATHKHHPTLNAKHQDSEPPSHAFQQLLLGYRRWRAPPITCLFFVSHLYCIGWLGPGGCQPCGGPPAPCPGGCIIMPPPPPPLIAWTSWRCSSGCWKLQIWQDTSSYPFRDRGITGYGKMHVSYGVSDLLSRKCGYHLRQSRR